MTVQKLVCSRYPFACKNLRTTFQIAFSYPASNLAEFHRLCHVRQATLGESPMPLMRAELRPHFDGDRI